MKMLLAGVSLCALALPANSAFAQDMAATAPDAAAAADAATPEGGLEEIVVTAQRREENLQRAAVAVSAVTGQALTNAGVSDVANLTKLVPALVVQPQGGSSTNFYIRGVGTYGTNAFAENAVAFNFAGVYVARPTSPVGTLFDLERIEVVKGPQGTLYGRNATGGAINALPNRPRLGDFSGSFTGEYGNYNTVKASAMVNVPLGGSAAIRLAGQVVNRDGYLSQGYDDENGQAIRASLLVKPSDAFETVLIADYYHQGGKGVGSVLIPDALAKLAPPIEDRIAGSDPLSVAAVRAAFPPLVNSGLVLTPGNDGFADSKFWGLTMVNTVDLGFATLTVIPAYRRSEPDFLSYNNGFLARVTEVDDQYSLEARLASQGSGPLSYVLGAYYFHEKQDAQDTFSQGRIATTIFNPVLKTTSKAVFGQLTYALTDGFRVVGGVRYTDEQKSQDTPLKLLSPTNPNPPFTRITGDLSFSRVTWKAGVELDAGPRSLVYANVATGFKAGGFYVAAIDNTFRPEKLTAYTVGSKNRFLDNRLQLNVEGFYWKYADQQVNFVGPAQYAPGVYAPGGITVNAGNARMYGVDLDVLFQPIPESHFSANVQYLNSKYNSFDYLAFSPNGAPVRTACAATRNASLPVAAPAALYAVDCAGFPSINAPKWTANIGYAHDFRIGDLLLTPSVRTRIETSRFLAIDYLPEERQGAYRSSDLSLTLAGPDDRWSITGFVNNVEDRTIRASAAQRGIIPLIYSALRPPRTYGVRAGFNF